MLVTRYGDERGRSEASWLSSRHSFSFAAYCDPAHLGFRALRVIDEDVVQPGGGFGMHPHRDREILSYVVRGALEHRDGTGNGSVIRAGEVQRTSAGTGVSHGEFNASETEVLHFLQICSWYSIWPESEPFSGATQEETPMSDPIIADDKPRTVTLEPGKSYAWCACGHSATQPFCDGSHRGTPFRPKVFRVESPEEAYLCMCKRTKNAPHCDGTHRNLEAGEDSG